MSGVFIPLSSHTKDYSGMIFAFLADMSGFMFCLLHYMGTAGFQPYIVSCVDSQLRVGLPQYTQYQIHTESVL